VTCLPKKWAVGFWLGIFLLSMPYPVRADLSRGSFIPCWSAQADNAETRPITYYSIKPGDTLWAIAQRYKIPLETLLISNGLTENSLLRVGDTIKIPSSGTAIHVVSRGETIWDIARQYAVTVEAIQSLNRNKNPNQLRIGEELLIPDHAKRMVAVAPSRSKSTLTFSWPLSGTISSGYGWRKSGFHHGIDIAADAGVPFRASAGGIVSFVGYHNIYGNMIKIDHGNGLETLYGHASKIYVQKGQRVVAGQIIAAVGASGYTTGPHLHFEVRLQSIAKNPLMYLK